MLYENVVARGEQPLFQLRRKPVHGGGHLQKIGACERHLMNVVTGHKYGGLLTRPSGYLQYLDLCDKPYSVVRMVDVVGRRDPHSKKCRYCDREKLL